jgi:hypothetical protein
LKSTIHRLLRIESTPQHFLSNLEKLGSELTQRGYNRHAITAAFDKVKSLPRLPTLSKVQKPVNERPVLVIPYDKRLPDISGVLKHRWECLVSRDPRVLDYMPKPPMVCYSRTKNLRDILVRSKVPPPQYRQARRQVQQGFHKCRKRADCCVCPHSTNTTTHTCNFTGESYPIKGSLSCDTSGVIYSVTCTKQTAVCAQLRGPQYIGCTGRPAKTRFSEHLGSVTQQCQLNTQKPVGVHFRVAGHSHSDMVFLPIEKVHSRDKFVLEARESFWIKQYNSVKIKPVNQIEHGLNLIP